jgi:hypothetical protein
MRRHPDMRLTHDQWSTGDAVVAGIMFLFGVIGLVGLLWLLAFVFGGRAEAHDIWISQGQHRNPAGEWCCGANDCGVVASSGIKAVQGGYSIRSTVTYGVGITGNPSDGPTHSEPVNEIVPYSQSLPSPDGSFWRCKRPDGSNRCFFAPKPDM